MLCRQLARSPHVRGHARSLGGLRFASNLPLKERRVGVIGLGNVGEALVKKLQKTG